MAGRVPLKFRVALGQGEVAETDPHNDAILLGLQEVYCSSMCETNMKSKKDAQQTGGNALIYTHTS